MNNTQVGKSLQATIGIPIENFCKHIDGFSFTTNTELNAYKAAYAYRYAERVTVKPATNDQWLVQVYKKQLLQPIIINPRTLNALFEFQNDATPDAFLTIFGKSLGIHLWDKFKNSYEFNLLKFYNGLDGKNRNKFANGLTELNNIVP